MQVEDIMTKDVVSVKSSMTLKQLLKTFSRFHMFPLIPVVGKDERLVGIISFRNLINAFHPHEPEILKTVPFLDEEEENIFKAELPEEIGNLVVVEDIMETKFIAIRGGASLEEAYNLMKLHLKEEFPVVDDDSKLIGMIGIFDIVREVFRQKGAVK